MCADQDSQYVLNVFLIKFHCFIQIFVYLYVTLADDEPEMGLPGMVPMGGRGLSTMTRPTT
jgi:hypothetical protein